MKTLPCPSSNVFKEKLSSFIENKIERDKYFMMGSRSHSIPCRSPSNLKIHNTHPLCHSPYHMGSYSHPPSRPRSSSSRLPTRRCHRMLVPEQCYRGWEIHRTSKPGYSEHSNLHSNSSVARQEETKQRKQEKKKGKEEKRKSLIRHSKSRHISMSNK